MSRGSIGHLVMNPLRVKWYKRKLEWKQSLTGGMPEVFLKDGLYKFGSYQGRTEFVKNYTDLVPFGGSLLQVVQDGPCRLYCDVEQIFEHPLLPNTEQKWIQSVIQCVQSCLTMKGVPDEPTNDVRVDCKSRQLKNGRFKSVRISLCSN